MNLCYISHYITLFGVVVHRIILLTLSFVVLPLIASSESINYVNSGSKKMDYKVVFHMDWEQPEVLNLALENMNNLLEAVPKQTISIHLVANGSAVNLFRKDVKTDYVQTIEELKQKGVTFSMCRNALIKRNLQEKDLLESCDVVPAGILEIIKLQHSGYAYVKP
jgi:uncharacterized protein